MNWVPVLNGLNKERAIETLSAIRRTTPITYTDSSLMYGKGGLILWLAYLSKYNDEIANVEGDNSPLNVFLEEIIDLPETELSFGKGVLGNSWLIAHLIRGNFLPESDDIFSNVVEEFEAIGSKMIDEGNYDYMLAGLGSLLFFLEIDKKDSIENMYEKLRKTAIISSHGITWKESPIVRNLSGQGSSYNLGLAHGIPGIMTIISLLNQNGDISMKSKYRDTILRVSDWLLGKTFNFPDSKARFPFSFGDDETPFPTSIRWCYGDLGVAYSLYLSGKNINESRLEKEGIKLAKQCITRNNESKNIIDAHLCHGTAGIAHIYNRFYNSTRDEVFRDAATFWFEETFRKFNMEFEFGFQGWKGEKHGWQNFPGLLEGSAGIGLALISAISEIEPKWDRCLLLS